MKPLKAKYTDWVLYVASKIPWVFSSRIRLLSESDRSPPTETMRAYLEKDDGIVAANLFEEGVKWRGVSFIASLGQCDLAKVHRWMSSKQQRSSRFFYGANNVVDGASLLVSGMHKLGVVSFDRSQVSAVGTVSLVAKLPHSCSVSLLRLSNGVFYLSLYVSLDESVEAQICNVDVRGVKRYKCFGSINPFSRKFSFIEDYSRRELVEKLIYGKAQDIVSETHQAVSTLLQIWGVKKSMSEFTTAADFFREGAGPYFTRLETGGVDANANCLTVVMRSNQNYLCSPISEDPSEEYIDYIIPVEIGVGAVFIKSGVVSIPGQARSYAESYNNVTDGFAFRLMLEEIYSGFNRCMSKVSPVFLGKQNSTQSVLKVLVASRLSLNLIDERLRAVEDGMHWINKQYRSATKTHVENIRSQINALGFNIDKRKELNDSELQLKNLIWTKRYSVVVFVLVVVQIGLSLINVDWTESGRSKNPIYMNLFSSEK